MYETRPASSQTLITGCDVCFQEQLMTVPMGASCGRVGLGKGARGEGMGKGKKKGGTFLVWGRERRGSRGVHVVVVGR